MSDSNIVAMFTAFHEDVETFNNCLAKNMKITPSLVKILWAWFPEVEIEFPIAGMILTEEESTTLATVAAGELVDVVTQMKEYVESVSIPDDDYLMSLNEQAGKLWREIASIYSTLVNSLIPVHELDTQEQFYSTFIPNLIRQGVEEGELRHELQTNPVLRMSIRTQGFNPDLIR